jgi:NhaA family Na+:H+ antiporter
MAIKTIKKYLKLEAASGVALFIFAVLAILLDNSPFSPVYQQILTAPLEIHLLNWVISKPLLFWINEGLMTIFFLLVSLELKREFLVGELAGFDKIVLPGVAAIGGMVLPALIYLSITHADAVAMKGWAVPVATDIAFALGVLSLFGKRVPIGLKLFLMALAIFDDVGAIIIIAVAHSQHLSFVALGLSAVVLLALFLLNFFNVVRLTPYVILGFVLWFCVLSSGVHATVAGVLLALLIPLRGKSKHSVQPLTYLEDNLHPWVAFFVMPLFAFANSGVSLQGLTFSILLEPIPLGIIAGLAVGKQLGVFSSVWLLVRLGYAKLPADTGWLGLYGVALLCGIGFTMSLFLGTLAFQNDSPLNLIEVRLGVLLGSTISGVLAALVLNIALSKKTKGRLSA